jgi:hypothetical protein
MRNIVFFIYSEEEFALCPMCGKHLLYHSWVKRKLTDIFDIKNIYNIRVMKCNNEACTQTYHRELPDIIIPYRRYDANSIETAIEHDKSGILIAPDESTIKRWQAWFKISMIQIMMALISVAVGIEEDAETSSLATQKRTSTTPLEAIKEIVGRKVRWLNEATRILVNFAKWNFNRSAFLSG